MTEMLTTDLLVGLPKRPEDFEELLRSFAGAASIKDKGDLTVVVQAYGTYVQQLAQQLRLGVERIVGHVQDEQLVARAIAGLFKMELDHRERLKFILKPPHQQISQGNVEGFLPAALTELRYGVQVELELLRDNRLRLEFYRAELINGQRRGPKTRIILQGGSQIRIHLSRTPTRAT